MTAPSASLMTKPQPPQLVSAIYEPSMLIFRVSPTGFHQRLGVLLSAPCFIFSEIHHTGPQCRLGSALKLIASSPLPGPDFFLATTAIVM